MLNKLNKKERVIDKRTISEIYGIKEHLYIKPNERYKNIKNIIYTGPTKKNAIRLSSNMINKQRNEPFHRIKSSIVIQLLLSSENKHNEEINQEENNLKNDKPLNLSEILSEKKKVSLEELLKIEYLILDLREAKEYLKCHIKNSISYPSNLISQDNFNREMYMMKNKENKIIIVYHKDEKNGMSIADLLTSKGFNNIYLISGGFYEFSKLFPEYLIGDDYKKYIDEKAKRLKEKEIIFEKRNKYHYRANSEIINNDNVINSEINKKSFSSRNLLKNQSQAFNSNRKRNPIKINNNFL